MKGIIDRPTAMKNPGLQKFKQVGWFVAFWMLGVTAVAMIGFLIRTMLTL